MRTLLPSLDRTVSGMAPYHRAIRGRIVYDNKVLYIETQKMCHCSSRVLLLQLQEYGLELQCNNSTAWYHGYCF